MNQLAEKISASELEVLRVLWEAGDALPLTEIRTRLQERCRWEPTTIKTLVQRLCTKGVLAQEKRKVFFYRAQVSEAEYQEWATGDLLHKLYQGKAKNLVAALVHSEELSREDLEELRALFNREG